MPAYTTYHTFMLRNVERFLIHDCKTFIRAATVFSLGESQWPPWRQNWKPLWDSWLEPICNYPHLSELGL